MSFAFFVLTALKLFGFTFFKPPKICATIDMMLKWGSCDISEIPVMEVRILTKSSCERQSGSLTVLWLEAEVFCSSRRRLRATVVFPFSVFSSSMDKLSPVTSQDLISSWTTKRRYKHTKGPMCIILLYNVSFYGTMWDSNLLYQLSPWKWIC